MSILEQFPKDFAPRQIQKEILNEVEKKVKSGYKKIILCAPTGVGKSHIGATLAKYFDSSFVVTASKHLQDQYTRDFPFLLPVKGKQNFECLKLMESEKVPNPRRAIRWGLTCDKGQCKEMVTKNGKELIENCKFKPEISSIEKGDYDSDCCAYYLQKYLALVSKHSLWNYYSYFQIMKYNKKAFRKFLDRKISIFDEAHKIEDQIIQFVGIDIAKGRIQECELDVIHYDLGNIDSMIKLLDNMADFYARKIEKTKAISKNPDYDLLFSLEDKYMRVSNARVDIVSDKENFVINDPERDTYGDFKKISVKPIDISKFVNSFFESEYQLFMSATIDKQSFCENTGMNPEEVAFVDTPKSPFTIENRKINFLNVKRLSYGATPKDEIEVIKKIDEILNKHSQERGIIFTSSKSRCYQIAKNLSEQNQRRIRICHSINSDGKTQNQVIQEHKADKRGVLLSSSLWEGVDLKDDLSRFQIVAKVPYPNYKEKRTSAKMNKFPSWYTSQTLMKLLQGFGRSVRSEEDWAITYVLDTAANNVFFKARPMIPKSYYDVLGLEN